MHVQQKMAGEKKEEDFEDVGSQEGAVGGQLPMHALVETMLQTMQQTMQQQAALLKDMQVRQDRGEQRLMQFMQKFEPVLGKLEEKEEAGGTTKMADTYVGDVHDSGLGVTSTTGVPMSMVSQLVSSPGNIEIAADPAVKPRSSLLLRTPLDSHRDMCNRVDGAIGIHAHAQSTPLTTRGPRGRGRSPAGGGIGSPGSFFTDGLEYQNLDPAARHSRGGRGEVTFLNQPHNDPGEVSPTVPAMEGQSSGRGAIRSTAPDSSGPNQSRARPAQTPIPCCISTKLLAPFNGSEDWNVFVGPFERMARKKGWTDEERLDRLHERLRGPAVAFVMTLPENIREDYARLTEQLKQRFGKHIPTSTARRQLSELRQGKEASLGEFAEEVRRLVTLAYPNCTMELQDEFAAEAFLKGLRKPQVAYEVMNTDPKTLAEAQRLVEAREHNFKATVGRDCEGKGKIRRVSWEDDAKKGGTAVSTPPPVPQIPPEIQALVTDMAGVVKEMKRQLQLKHPDSNTKSEERGRSPVRAPGNASASTRPGSPSPTTTTKGQCYQCGEVGHFKRNCSRSPSPGLAEKKERQLSIKLARAQGDGPSLLVPITVNQLQLKCVIDTGAEATVMSQDTFQKLHLTDSPTGEPAYLLNAESGKEMGTSSKYSVTIKLGSKSRVWDVYVAPIRDPFLLGLDFILAANMTMLNGGQVLIEGEPVATTIAGRSVEDYAVSRVLLLNPSTLPAESECDVWGVVEGPRPGVSAVLEPAGLADGVSSGSVVVEMEEKIPVRLCNLSPATVKLPEGTCLGILIEAEVEPTATQQEAPAQDERSPAAQVRRLKPADVLDLPTHLRGLFTSASEGLTEDQQEAFLHVLLKYQSIFAASDQDLGQFGVTKHRIDTGAARPVRQPARRTPLGFQGEEERHLRAMLEAGVITPSTSEWAAPVVLVRKKDGGVRWCIDYRKLNELTLRDAYPLPKIEECLDTLEGSAVFSTLDLQSGYWQIEVHEPDRCKTAFITKYGLYEYVRMPFGLCNAPSTFQRAMEVVLRGLQWQNLLVYLDDVIVLGKGVDDSLDNLAAVFERMQQYGLKLKPTKCHLLQDEVLFLGHVVSGRGISPNPDLLVAVRDWSPPTCLTELQAFLGLCNYYRRFVRSFSEICTPLHELQGKGVEFHWGERQQRAFEELKSRLMAAPILSYPTPTGQFLLDTDASNVCVGAVLSQLQDGEEKVIAYGSAHLQSPQQRYCVTRRELLAVVRFTRQYRHYLLGRSFVLRTDHNSLTWLFRFKNPEGQLARWIEELSQYDFQIEHRPGTKHGNADALSRAPGLKCDCYQAGKDLSSLPCGGCPHCQKAHQQWSRFEEDVDDVIPLAIRRITEEESSSQESEPGVEPVGEGGRIDTPVADVPGNEDGDAAQRTAPVVNWIEQHSGKEMEEEQRRDPVLSKLHQWMDEGVRPTQDQVALEAPAVRMYWLCWGQFERQQGVLYYRWESGSNATSTLRLLVPLSLQREVLESCHYPPQSGHLGVGKTLHRAQQSFYWRGMREDVKLFIKRCQQCQKCKSVGRPGRAPLQMYQAGAPLDRVHMDVAGPFPVTNAGNKYIMVIIDQFTRWVEAVPISEQTAEVTAKALIHEFVSRFGSPLELHTDQGRNFESDMFAEVCRLFQVAKTRTTPYHPASNGQVERFNKTLLQMVRCYVDGNQKNWDEHLPLLTAAYRSSPHACTGFTPNRMMLGREVHQPQSVSLGVAEANRVRSSPAEYVASLEEQLRETHELAREHLKVAQRKQKRDYDLRAQQRAYQAGDLVYVRDSTRKRGQSPKLQPPWKGPSLVTERIGPVLYRVRDKRSSRVLHHDRLLPCSSDVVPAWMRRQRHALLQEGGNEDLEGSPTSPVTSPNLQASGTAPPDNISGDDRGTSEPLLNVNGTTHMSSTPTRRQTAARRRRGARRRPVSPSEPSSSEDEPDGALLQLTRRGRPVNRPARFRDD